MLKLTVEKRESKKDLESLRASGKIPAVFYGPKAPSTSIAVNASEFNKVLKQAGESSVIELVGEGIDHEALIHDVDFDPVTVLPVHVDFYVIEKGKKVTVHVPLELVGVAPAVKELGGSLVKVLHEIEIEAMPKDLPHSIKVDISSLVNFDAQIHARDLVMPAQVTCLTDEDEVIALVQPAREDEPETPSEAFDPSKIEVQERGKKDEEAEA